MSFHEVLFPVAISRGAKLLSEHRSQVHRLSSGAVSSVLRWPNELWSFDVGFGVKGARAFSALRTAHEFWLLRQGHANGFRFRNPFENTTAADGTSASTDTDVVIGAGDGVTTQFQLLRKITDATGTITRTIQKPVAGTIGVAVDGTPATITEDTATGLIQITSTVPAGGGSPASVTAGCQFDLPCKFSPNMSGLSFQIETQAGLVGKAPSILIMELASTVMNVELPYRGSGSAPTFSADLLHDFATMGQTIYLAPTTSGLDFVLPTLTDIPQGAILNIINGSAVDSFTVSNRTTAATEFTVAASTGIEVYCVEVPAGTKTWEGLKGTT